MNHNLTAIRNAQALFRRAQFNYHMTVAKYCPVGSRVQWLHGRHPQEGIVATVEGEHLVVTKNKPKRAPVSLRLHIDRVTKITPPTNNQKDDNGP